MRCWFTVTALTMPGALESTNMAPLVDDSLLGTIQEQEETAAAAGEQLSESLSQLQLTAGTDHTEDTNSQSQDSHTGTQCSDSQSQSQRQSHVSTKYGGKQSGE